MTELDKFLERELAAKKRAFDAGCMGALTDVNKLCHDFDAPLPTWAANEVSKALGGLMGDINSRKKPWSSWFKRYKKDMADYEIYEEVQAARKHGVEWKDIYDVVASTLANRFNDTQAETIKKAYKRTNLRMKSDPYLYHVLTTIKSKPRDGKSNVVMWDWVRTIRQSSKPRSINKDDLG